MSVQQVVMNEIKFHVESLGYSFVVDYRASNTGTARVMKGLKPLLGFTFDFQSTWQDMSFQFYPGDKEIVSTIGFTHPNCIRKDVIAYHQIESKVEELLKFIKDYTGKIPA